jgi:ABC-type uncharacterized transport system YnjBCD permease subunit
MKVNNSCSLVHQTFSGFYFINRVQKLLRLFANIQVLLANTWLHGRLLLGVCESDGASVPCGSNLKYIYIFFTLVLCSISYVLLTWSFQGALPCKLTRDATNQRLWKMGKERGRWATHHRFLFCPCKVKPMA